MPAVLKLLPAAIADILATASVSRRLILHTGRTVERSTGAALWGRCRPHHSPPLLDSPELTSKLATEWRDATKLQWRNHSDQVWRNVAKFSDPLQPGGPAGNHDRIVAADLQACG